MGIKVSVCMLQHDQMTTLPMTTITKQNDFNIMKVTVRVRLPSAGVGRKMAALASPCSVILQKKKQCLAVLDALKLCSRYLHRRTNLLQISSQIRRPGTIWFLGEPSASDPSSSSR